MKLSTVIAAAAALAGTSDAFWRMECKGRVGLARIDPLVTPGGVAQHAHTIHGSSGFSESCSYDDIHNADCTSCAVIQDKSVYWTPMLYFHHDDGNYEMVPQVGGMLAYYFLNPPPGQTGNITAFPNDFRMIAGDSMRRNYSISGTDYKAADPEKSLWAMLGQTTQVDLAQRATGFNCLNYGKDPEGSLYRHYLPDKDYLDANCVDGVRFEIMFPSCWNGKDTDSPDHKSHVAYPDLVMNGNCPPGFPVQLPGLFYETIWNTYAFVGKPGTFVISNGDPQGFGYHADFIMGWDEGFLQNAVDTCTNGSGRIEDCGIFTIQSEADQNMCQMKKPLPAPIINEQLSGVIGTSLPGNVQIQYGPQPANPAATKPSEQTATVVVPSVSYSPGSTATSSGSYIPGQVFKESKTSAQATASPNAVTTDAAAAGQPTSNPGNSSPTTLATSTTAPEPTSAQAPPTTPEPTTTAPTAATDDGLPIVSTQYITVGNMVSEVVWKEAVVYVTESQDITVTVTIQPTSSVQAVRKLRRSHDHAHVHRQLRHGGRR